MAMPGNACPRCFNCLPLIAKELLKVMNGVQVDEYDRYLVGYQQASVATETIAAVLNGGQGFVLAAGLTAVLASATLSSAVGSFTAGDLVRWPTGQQY